LGYDIEKPSKAAMSHGTKYNPKQTKTIMRGQPHNITTWSSGTVINSIQRPNRRKPTSH